MFDFTQLSPKNKPFSKKIVTVANQSELVALDLPDDAVLDARGVLYIHINTESRKSYVGITIMRTGDRWATGNGYRFNRRFGSAIKKWGWDAFEHHILAFVEDREAMDLAEIEAIAAVGGHKSKFTYNLSPGGDAVAENDKPLLGVYLETGEETLFKSGVEAFLSLDLANIDSAGAVARGEITATSGWWFRFPDDESATPPEEWGEELRVSQVRRARERGLKAINYDTGEERHFKSVSLAAKAFGVHQSTISGVAMGEYMSAKSWWFCYLDDDRKMPTSFGDKATREKRDKKVYAINLGNGERREYRNATVASDDLELYESAASRVISGKITSAGGWWFTHDGAEKPPTEYAGALVAKYKSIPVIAENIETGEIQRFANAKRASEALGIQRSSISNIIRGKRKNAKGYTFRKAALGKFQQ